MKYCEKLPSPGLAEHIKCFWSLEYGRNQDGGSPEPVVPDGCVEIVFNLADRFRRYHANGEIETQPSSLVAGQIERSILIQPSGEVRLFGIRFKPTGAIPFFDLEMSSLANRIDALESLWGTSVREIEERIWHAAKFDAQIAVAEMALLQRMRRRVIVDPVLNGTVASISAQNGSRTVRDLAREVGVSERGLERKFKRYVGLSPKAFSRIVRFQAVLRAIELNDTPDILDTAHHFGYYDQSHLIRDFQQYSGMSPSSYMDKTQGITELFIAAK